MFIYSLGRSVLYYSSLCSSPHPNLFRAFWWSLSIFQFTIKFATQKEFWDKKMLKRTPLILSKNHSEWLSPYQRILPYCEGSVFINFSELTAMESLNTELLWALIYIPRYLIMSNVNFPPSLHLEKANLSKILFIE